ncbi:MAG: PEGA domain-containing protein, partial [bacterium]|nr:PEGA domain-containing protein [bacterium]
MDEGNIEEKINSELATLVITSDPSGAEITVNGVVMGLTPITFSRQRPGTYEIKISKAGYDDWITTAVLYPGKTTNVHADLGKPVIMIVVLGIPRDTIAACPWNSQAFISVELKDKFLLAHGARPEGASVLPTTGTKTFVTAPGVPGTFEVRLELSEGTHTAYVTKTVTVETSKVHSIKADPSFLALEVGQTSGMINLIARDQFGNQVPNISGTFTVASGTMTPIYGTQSVYKAGTTAGVVVITLTAVQDSNTFVTTCVATITPGAITNIIMSNNATITATLASPATITVIGTPTDKYGNVVDTLLNWSLQGIGAISPQAGAQTVFSGTQAGTNIITASTGTTQGSMTVVVIAPQPKIYDIVGSRTAGVGFEVK